MNFSRTKVGSIVQICINDNSDPAYPDQPSMIAHVSEYEDRVIAIDAERGIQIDEPWHGPVGHWWKSWIVVQT